MNGLPFKKVEKDELVRIIQRFSAVYAVEVLGYSVMGSHFHLLVEVSPGSMVPDDEVRRRFQILYGDDKDIKQTFSNFYNKRKKRKGTLWGERFKSVIVQQGNTLINCLAYIDLNAVRAGIVKRPEAYRWCPIGYHVQAGNKDGFLSMELGLSDFGVDDLTTWLRKYREFLYHVGAIEKRGRARITKKVLDEETSEGFELIRVRRFRFRTRYFTDSGIIGSRAFVETTYGTFKDRFQAKREKVPTAVKGIDGMYSLKHLAEA